MLDQSVIFTTFFTSQKSVLLQLEERFVAEKPYLVNTQHLDNS